MTVGYELVTYLISKGVGTVLGTDIFVGSLPATPDACVCLYEAGGLASEHGFSVDGVDKETPTVQILCRGVAHDWSTPRALAETAYRALAEIQATTLSGVFYEMVTPIQPPFKLKQDENDRFHIVFHVRARKNPS